MGPREKCEAIADEIKQILSKGIDVSDDVAHYIDSTFSNPAVQELKTILADDSNCEKDSLLELLFFPDESMQMALEETLERYRPQKEDENKILNYLNREPLQITFRFRDERGAVRLLIPQDVARQFITRLNISRHLDPILLESILNYGDDKNCNRFKVKIRNSRFCASGKKTGFLCGFFDKIGARSDDIFECLEFVLEFLDEIKKDSDIYRSLMARKKFYFISLQKAQKMDGRLEKYNVETLMARGERVVLIDQADIRKKMQLIDRISRAVFGKTEYFEQPVSDERHMEIGSPKAVESIVKKLF